MPGSPPNGTCVRVDVHDIRPVFQIFLPLISEVLEEGLGVEEVLVVHDSSSHRRVLQVGCHEQVSGGIARFVMGSCRSL